VLCSRYLLCCVLNYVVCERISAVLCLYMKKYCEIYVPTAKESEKKERQDLNQISRIFIYLGFCVVF